MRLISGDGYQPTAGVCHSVCVSVRLPVCLSLCLSLSVSLYPSSRCLLIACQCATSSSASRQVPWSSWQRPTPSHTAQLMGWQQAFFSYTRHTHYSQHDACSSPLSPDVCSLYYNLLCRQHSTHVTLLSANRPVTLPLEIRIFQHKLISCFFRL